MKISLAHFKSQNTRGRGADIMSHIFVHCVVFLMKIKLRRVTQSNSA